MLPPKPADSTATPAASRAARVLIVDDSAIVRQVLQSQLSRQPGVEVVGAVADPFAAREKILALKPDCLILDIEMPKMDGLTFLKKLMKFHPLPTIVCSSITPSGCGLALECLEAGAFEVVAKPGGNFSVGEVALRLAELVRAAADAHPQRPRVGTGAIPMPEQPAAAGPAIPSAAAPRTSGPTAGTARPFLPPARPGLAEKLVAIGTSTGGTEALRTVLTALPPDSPPMVMVQHMPEGFTKAFADRLNTLCQISVKEAEDGDVVFPGQALLAPGNRHMRVVRNTGPSGARWMVRVADGPRVLRHKPSVEVLFESCAQIAGSKALGIIMTGMGNDGVNGLLSMRKAGAITVGQDEQSCVVYGMPREAALCGAVQLVSPLDRIARHIIDFSHGALVAHAA